MWGGLEKFDVVAGFDVIEHFTVPIKALKHVAKILNEDGICIFQTPNNKSDGKEWLQFKPEEHLFLFSEQNIYLLFDEVLKIDAENADNIREKI